MAAFLVEQAYLDSVGVETREQFLELRRTGIEARVLESGDGPLVLMVYGGVRDFLATGLQP